MLSLREIPAVHEFLETPSIQILSQYFSRELIVKEVRHLLETVRKEVIQKKSKWDIEKLSLHISKELCRLKESQFRKVINGTGILIHTNLGRAPLSQKALKKIVEIGGAYSTVEYDLEAGKRGERNDHLEKIITGVTGGQRALVVNNNAAALLLCLNTLADQKEVLVSRGELIEIGASFRLPDIMKKSGVILKEVGTTNKTKSQDYEKALSSCTGLILKVHTSNFKIVGFTEEVQLKELVSLSKKIKRPLIFDAGSGLILKKESWVFKICDGFGEPSIQDSIKAGVDIVTFSGDKLLGGPQAGIIVGKEKWISKLMKNPLYRTMRVDKIILAALEETFRHYLFGEESEIPYLQLLSCSVETLEKRANDIKEALRNGIKEGAIQIEKGVSKIGGGSFPHLELPTVLLSIALPKEKLLVLEKQLRFPQNPNDIPIIGRIQKNRYILDFRTIFESHLADIEQRLQSVLI